MVEPPESLLLSWCAQDPSREKAGILNAPGARDAQRGLRSPLPEIEGSNVGEGGIVVALYTFRRN
jgi:hypothetical protein